LLPESILYESDHLKVRHRPVAGSRNCVVTFAHYSARPRKERLGFGEDFFLAQGISAVHVTCAGNSCYQYPDAAEIGRAVVPLRACYHRLVTYGSSMGGYGSLLFADDCRADAVIAASPQSSIDPSRIPFDVVRARAGAGLTILRDEIRIRPGTEVYLIYDDMTVDGMHAANISQQVEATHLVARGAGHPALPRLAQARVLTPAILALVEGGADVGAIRRSFRGARRFSSSYLKHLAGRTQRYERQIGLLRRARQLDPMRMDLYATEARVHAKRRAFDEAEAVLLLALSAQPGHASTRAQYAELLLRMGRVAEGLTHAASAAAVAPESPHAQRVLQRFAGLKAAPARPA
jgi:hypothetical protein